MVTDKVLSVHGAIINDDKRSYHIRIPSNQCCKSQFYSYLLPIKLTPKSGKPDAIDFFNFLQRNCRFFTMLSDDKPKDMNLMRHQFGEFYSEVQTEKQKHYTRHLQYLAVSSINWVMCKS